MSITSYSRHHADKMTGLSSQSSDTATTMPDIVTSTLVLWHLSNVRHLKFTLCCFQTTDIDLTSRFAELYQFQATFGVLSGNYSDKVKSGLFDGTLYLEHGGKTFAAMSKILIDGRRQYFSSNVVVPFNKQSH